MSLEILFKSFPVPRCLNVEGVGVDLSEVSLRFVKLAAKNGDFELADFGEYSLPEGTISLGQIKNPGALKEILLRFKKEHDIEFIHLSLPESLAYLSEMEISAVKKSEMYESIELQLEEHIPIKVADAVFDYSVVKEGNAQGDTSVVVLAAPKDVIAFYANVFAEVGISLLSLETDSNALARAVIPSGSMETSMILDLGRIKTGVYVVSQGVVCFTSDIDIGEKEIISALKKELNITHDEADEMMRSLRSDKEPSEEVFKIFSAVITELKEEVNKHFIYWQTHRDKSGIKKEPINSIILCGSGSSLFGLPECFSEALNVPTEMANVWRNVFSFEKEIPKISFQDSLLYSTAIGLSLYSKK
ncbi:MAG: pilus assembly protein PilM [Candidatus Parcubacteria bacterium]|nr:pilus assembly protein PilM [Candidatus Parcubacteria bacterium]